ncbi:MAG: hypothetical protein OXU20_39725 [Myxococcales bacterium]|nr:hypothetical protein [Myxococcales bacterium]MDD9967841.1 hypothetical protein [Myxococcales bacterium]
MRLSLVFCLLVGGFGCGSEDARLGLLGEACNVSNECAEPLECLQVNAGGPIVGMCSQNCESDADPSCMSIDQRAVCRELHCTYTCAIGGRCQNGGSCIALNPSAGRCVP